ncbi:ankyrin repeat-containing domain protein, partial [Chaetomium tenue]
APLNRANSEGWTVLIEAAHRDLPTVCRILLERGADPNLMEDLGKVALHGAARVGSASIVRDLLAKDSVVNQAMADHKAKARALCDAVEYGHREVAAYLLDMGCPVNGTDSDSVPIARTQLDHHSRTVQLLVQRGADLNRVVSPGGQVLSRAAALGAFESVKILVDGGAELEGESNGYTPLCSAIYWERLDIVRFLLERGA